MMKKIFILSFLLTSVFASNANKYYNPRLCKIFNIKIMDYKNNNRKDAYAKATLISYQKRAKLYCSK